MSQVITFDHLCKPKTFAGLTGHVDFEQAKIHGVSLITSDVEASGHGLYVDDTTVRQLHELGKSMGQVPVTQNHEGGVEDVNGYVENIRMDGKHLRGDWCLLQTHPDTPTMLERAARQPKTFGLSAAFKGDPKGVLYMGKRCARAEQLLSVDVVKRPAANPLGLFSAKDDEGSVDSPKKSVVRKPATINLDTMPQNPNQEPSLADVLAAINQSNEQQAALAERIDQMQGAQDQLVSHINEGVTGRFEDDAEGEGQPAIDRDTLEALNNASDEDLAERGITREDVDAAVSEFNASLNGEQTNESQWERDGGEQDGGEQGGERGAAMAGVEGGAAAGTALSAIQRELVQLKAQVRARDVREKRHAEEIRFSEVSKKIDLIVQQRDAAIELAERLVAKNEALEMHFRTGTRPVNGSTESMRLFSANDSGELHPFQQRIRDIKLSEKVSDGKALMLASAENPALHMDFIQSQKGRRIALS